MLGDTLSVLPQSKPDASTQRINSAFSLFATDQTVGSSSNSIFGSLGSFLQGVGNTALNLWGQKNTYDVQKAQAKANWASAQQPSASTVTTAGLSEVTPILVAGGVGIVAILLLSKK